MYELLGISLALVALLSINTIASVAVAGMWRLLDKPLRPCDARTRAKILFAMRVGPPGIAVTSVGAFLIPSYLVYEPHSTTEFVSTKLAVLAIISGAGIALALWRGCYSWLATRALLRQWLGVATPLRLSHIHIPAFKFPHSFPIIAVVGTLRPRLFVAERVFESLNEEELIAAIAHECGHLAARDNLKRLLMRACRDMLAIVPAGRSIDLAWAEEAEAAADEHAARRGPSQALNLASALIGIARMVPVGARPTLPAATFLLGDDVRGVKARVSRLIALAESGEHHSSVNLASWIARSVLALLLTGVVMIMTNTHALASFHLAMERIVRVLT